MKAKQEGLTNKDCDKHIKALEDMAWDAPEDVIGQGCEGRIKMLSRFVRTFSERGE